MFWLTQFEYCFNTNYVYFIKLFNLISIWFDDKVQPAFQGVVGQGFWQMENIALILGHIVFNFEEISIYTLGNMNFLCHFLIMAPIEKNWFSKINLNLLSPIKFFKVCIFKKHICASILGKFYSCSRTLILWKITFNFFVCF